MRVTPEKWKGVALSVGLFATTAAGCAHQQPTAQAAAENPRPGASGHRAHEEWQGSYPSLDSQKAFRVVNVIAPPKGFLGNIAYDTQRGRLWLISMGKPTNPDGSKLYEIDPKTGAVLRTADLPFAGDLASPVFVDGYLYEGVYHQSKMYKVSVGDVEPFGAIVREVNLPTLTDLKLTDEVHPMPFIEFGGVAQAPGDKLVFHADDVGELITIDRETGKLVQRVRTLKALGGIATVVSGDNYYVLGNSDPRGAYCALSYPPAVSRSPDQKDISWALINGNTGSVLASIRRQNSPAYAATVSLMKHEEVAGTPYGRFTFLATGEQGILTLEWTPSKDAY